MGTQLEELAAISSGAIEHALPYAIEGSKSKFVGALVDSIATSVGGPALGEVAKALVTRILEGGLESHADEIFKAALADMQREERRSQLVSDIAAETTAKYSQQLSHAVQTALEQGEGEMRQQLGNAYADIRLRLDALLRGLSPDPQVATELLRAYGALDRKFEAYVLAAKDVRDRFEFDGDLLLEGTAASEDALTAAITKYNAIYEDIRVSKFADEEAVLRHIGPKSALSSMLKDVYSAILDDVHRRGVYGLNSTRVAMLELDKLAPASAERAAAARGAERELRMHIKDINESLEVLERKLSGFRAEIEALARPA